MLKSKYILFLGSVNIVLCSSITPNADVEIPEECYIASHDAKYNYSDEHLTRTEKPIPYEGHFRSHVDVIIKLRSELREEIFPFFSGKS